MSEKFSPIQEPRTSDKELIEEVSPTSITEQKQQMLSETEAAKTHEEHLERGIQIAELKEVLKASEKTGEEIQREIDQIKEQLADKESRILGKIFEIVQIFKLRRNLSGKEAEHQATSEEIKSLKTELGNLEEIHGEARKELEQTVSEFLSKEETTEEATSRAILEKKSYLESVREARDVSSMCERENCLVFHTILTKGYHFGTHLRTAPSENSPLDWDKAVVGGASLQADIALGYDIELSCSTIREGSEDAIWNGRNGAGGFIITGGSVRMAGDTDLGTRVDTQTGRRFRMGGGVNTSYSSAGKKDHYIRTDEDIHLAVTGEGRDIKRNHNELVVEEPQIGAVFLQVPENAKIIFTEDDEITEYIEENPENDHTGTFVSVDAFSEYLTIAKKNNLPIFGIYEGKAYKLGPIVQRIVKKHGGFQVNKLPWKEIALIPGEVSFEEIRNLSGVSEESKRDAKERVPEDVFRTGDARSF